MCGLEQATESILLQNGLATISVTAFVSNKNVSVKVQVHS